MEAQKTKERINYRNQASATHNLDKDPLQTGNKYSSVSLRTKCVMGMSRMMPQRFLAGVSACVLFAMLILMGSTALLLFIQVLKKHYVLD